MKNKMTDAKIIAGARIVSPQEAPLTTSEQIAIELLVGLCHQVITQLHFVIWPSGVGILVDGDPNDKAAWESQLVKCYHDTLKGRCYSADSVAWQLLLGSCLLYTSDA